MFRHKIDEGVEIRILEERHARELFALTDQNRAYLREWMPWLDSVESVEDTKMFIKSSLEQFANNDAFQAGIWLENRLAGVIGYHEIDWANRLTSIGYWIGASDQGKGLATKVCRALVEYAFKELELNRVEIRCATKNKRSQAIPKNLGFTAEGVCRQAEWLYDHYVDHVVFGILASQWED